MVQFGNSNARPLKLEIKAYVSASFELMLNAVMATALKKPIVEFATERFRPKVLIN